MIPLPSLPSGWKYVPVKRAAYLRFSSVNKHSVPGETDVRLCNYVDVYRNERITTAMDFMPATATTGEIARFSLTRGDVLLTKDSETPDDIGVPACVADDLPGVVCGYHLAMLRPRSSVDGRFLHRALQASGVRDQFHSTATGVTRFGLGLGDVGDALVPLPPLQEQRAIADFLDRKTAAIDALIEKKEKFLSILDARHEGLVTAAVLHGIEGKPLRHSGIEWIGETPSHWTTRRLGLVATSMQTGPFGSQLHASDYVDGGVPLVNPSHLVAGKIQPDPKSRVSETTLRRLARHQLLEGDVVFGRRGELGRCAVVGPAEAGWLCGTGSLRVRLDSNYADPGYVAMASTLKRCREWLVLQSVGATMDNLNTSILGRLPLPVPPLPEQRSIVAYTGKVASLQRSTRERLQLSVERIREYRQALITAAVTGQVDVGAQEAA